MKILLANDYFPPFTPGGAEWSSFFMAKVLIKQGHGVDVFTPNYGAEREQYMEGVHIHRFPFWTRLAPGNSLLPLWEHVNPIFHVNSAFWLWNLARQIRPDVIHVQQVHSFVSARFVGWLLNIPVFLTFRD